MLSPDIDMGDVPEFPGLFRDDDDDDDDRDKPYTGEDSLEDSDSVFVMTIPCEAAFI